MAAETKLLVFAILTLEGEGGCPHGLNDLDWWKNTFFNPKAENYLITHNKSSHKRY